MSHSSYGKKRGETQNRRYIDYINLHSKPLLNIFSNFLIDSVIMYLQTHYKSPLVKQIKGNIN